MFDVCVIGPLTKDILKIGTKVIEELPGGTAYYTSLALAALGLKVAVVTRVAAIDQEALFVKLREKGLEINCDECAQTLIYENHYPDATNLNLRKQRVLAESETFALKHVQEVSAKIYHWGGLRQADFASEVLAIQNKPSKSLYSLDLQGPLRVIENQQVVLKRPDDLADILRAIDILKVDETEARIATGETDLKLAAKNLARLGPSEVVLTMGTKGSLIYQQEQFFEIEACLDVKTVDATGCGDAYMAGYLSQRLKGQDVVAAARFGAKVAAQNSATQGALTSL